MKMMEKPCDGRKMVVNMRHSEENGSKGLVEARKPVKISELQMSCVLEGRFSGDETTFFHRNCGVYVSENGGKPELVLNLPSAVRCAVKTDEDSVLLSTENEMVRLVKRDGSWRRLESVDYPAVRFTTAEAFEMRSIVSGSTLKDSDGSKGVWLGREDAQNMSKQLYNAYSDIMGRARKSEQLVQPVFARYKLYGEKEELLYVSAPVLLSAPGKGFQFTNAVKAPLTDNNTKRGATELVALSYRPAIEICQHNKTSEVAYLTVELTSQASLADSSLTSACALRTDSTTGGRYVEAGVPGVYETMDYSATVASSLENCEKEFVPVYRLEQPFASGNAKTVILPKVSGKKKANDNAVVNSELSLPHRFVSREMAVSGENVIHGNIVRKRFSGYDAWSVAYETGNEPWAAAIAVKFRDGGETVVKYSEGNEGNPLKMSPVLSYPSEDAVSMTIYLSSGANIYRRSFDLTPSSTSQCAYYIEKDLRPIEFTGYDVEMFLVPAEKRVDKEYPGMLIASKIWSADLASEVDVVSTDEITHISNASVSQSGWEQSRSRYYVFSRDRVFAASINKAGRLQNFNQISTSGISGGEQAVTVPGKGVYYLSDGRLYRLQGVRSTEVTAVSAEKLCYDRRHGELWMAGEELWVLEMSSGEYYKRDIGEPVESATGSYVGCKSGTYNLNEEESGSLTHVEWREQIEEKDAERALLDVRKVSKSGLRVMKVYVSCGAAEPLVLSIYGDHGSGYKSSRKLYEFRYTGSLKSPIIEYVPTFPHYAYHLKIEGEVSGMRIVKRE